MSLPDVRDRDDYRDEWALRNALSRSLPSSHEEDQINMSGMDCFVAVIRHICSIFGRELIDHVAMDDSLKFVMADYSANTDEERNKVQEYRLQAFNKVKRLVGKENPTFEDIVECEQVRRRFWARDGLRLFLSVLYRGDKTSPWNSAFDYTFETINSLVHWRLEDYGKIEEVLMKTKFGVTSFSDGGEALSLFGNPGIMRIRISSKVNRATWKGGVFTIENARSFSCALTTRKTTRTRADGRTIVSDSSSGDVQDKIIYYLIAVVRLRNPGEDRDYTRLYDIESRNILPHGNQEHLGTFNNKLWSLSHLDHDHMLYYARADDRPMNCIRVGAEVAGQDTENEGDPRGETQMEELWQKRCVIRNYSIL